MCVETLEHEEKSTPPENRAVRVAVAGLGLIGEGAALRLLREEARYELCAALVNDASKPRPAIPEGVVVSEDADRILDTNPDVVIDALPVGNVGRALIEKALSRGVSVVSANKQAVASALAALSGAADEYGAALAYSASVGGGAPMVETVRASRDRSEIVSMAAILNGTVNFILSALETGAEFDDAVRQAQEAGFAEPDPKADLSGDDARAKIAILAFEAFGREIDPAAISTQPLTPERAEAIARSGAPWRQISRITLNDDGTVSGALDFEPVGAEEFFGGVSGEGNALQIELASGEIVTCEGKGAGRAPTVDSLFDDLGWIREKLLHPTEG